MTKQSSFATIELENRLRRVNKDSSLMKILRLIDWEALRPLCEGVYKRDSGKLVRGGQQPFDSIMMFKAVLLGQWHSLSDPKLEEALMVRNDFMLFCGMGFSDAVPDETTLCRYRNRLVEAKRWEKLLNAVNEQLQRNQLMVKQASAAVLDATLISSAARPRREQILEGELAHKDEHEGEVDALSGVSVTTDDKVADHCEGADKEAAKAQEPARADQLKQSADPDATWLKKNGKSTFGYRAYVQVESKDGYIKSVHTAPANQSEHRHFEQALAAAPNKPTRLYADKGFSSKGARSHLKGKGIKSGVMHRAYKNKPLTARQRVANKIMSKTRWIVEQAHGTLKRLFGLARASYIGTVKVQAQVVAKSICLNLLKAANKMLMNGEKKPEGKTKGSLRLLLS